MKPRTSATVLSSLLLGFLLVHSASADSATWSDNPTSNDWNTASNWTPETVPEESTDIATFATSAITDVSLSSSIRLAAISFVAGASPFSITARDIGTFDLTQAGIANKSGVLQNFVTSHLTTMTFRSKSSAGKGTTYQVAGDTVADSEGHAFLNFTDRANAGTAVVTIYGGEAGGVGGSVIFSKNSTAKSATLVVKGSPADENTATEGGYLEFMDTANASKAAIQVESGGPGPNSGGMLVFHDANAGQSKITVNGANGADSAPGVVIFGPEFFGEDANSGTATIIAAGGVNGGSGGQIRFGFDSVGDGARVILKGNGTLDVTTHYSYPGVTIGSIEGTGPVIIDFVRLSVGSNNLDTHYSGLISGSSGSVNKVGTGTLTIDRAQSYSAATTVFDGTLLLTNTSGSGTGGAPSTVDGGTLAGTGRTTGVYTSIGVSAGKVSYLSPGIGNIPGTFTSTGEIIFGQQGVLLFDVDSDNATSDQVVASSFYLSPSVETKSTITINDLGSSSLPSGTTFTILSNTGSSPISNRFGNLPDGGTVTVGNNTYIANYAGGDGNDLTLTVQ